MARGTPGTLTYLDSGWTAHGSDSVTPDPPNDAAAGDRIFIGVLFKRATNAPPTPAGWDIAHGPVIVGTGPPGSSTGPIGIVVFTKIHDGGPMPTITHGGDGATICATVVAYRAGPGEEVTWTGASGSDVTSNDTWAVTFDDTLGLRAGDAVAMWTGVTSYAQISAFTLTADGAALSPPTYEAGGWNSAGDDIYHYLHSATVTGGAATAAPVAGGKTISGNSRTGGALLLRVAAEVPGAAEPEPPAEPAWTLWDGTTEQPLTLEGVWNGATVTPATVDTVT